MHSPSTHYLRRTIERDSGQTITKEEIIKLSNRVEDLEVVD